MTWTRHHGAYHLLTGKNCRDPIGGFRLSVNSGVLRHGSTQWTCAEMPEGRKGSVQQTATKLLIVPVMAFAPTAAVPGLSRPVVAPPDRHGAKEVLGAL
ncbi:hypothetical protein [Paracoccus haematequi]|uniref:hypothetical protein n=1 Tax=Paracoccus haematequi TaxID=2491866 RepID=UPI0013DF8EB1|nr:hypothetical protein [Paracoccus haematequi]